MKIRSAGQVVVLLSLVAFGIGNALTPFSGVINPNTLTTVVDTAILNVLTTTDTFPTTGWHASGTTLDTFHFPDLSAWPSKVTLIGTIKGTPNTSVFSAPLPDTWYRFQYGAPVAPLVEFISPGTGLEESGSPRELLPCLNVNPTVVTSRMAISVRPVGLSMRWSRRSMRQAIWSDRSHARVEPTASPQQRGIATTGQGPSYPAVCTSAGTTRRVPLLSARYWWRGSPFRSNRSRP